jgi:hypothetical protein
MPKETDASAPLIPLDIIQTQLCERISARDARSVIRRLSELETLTHNFQFVTLRCILRDELRAEWTMTQLGSVFDINKGIVHRICSKEMADFEAHVGHPCLLSADQEGHVIEYIGTSFVSHCPVSPKQIRAHVQERYAIVASRG